jgi:hypothetical protein
LPKSEFNLLRKTTRLLLEVKRELGASDITRNESLIAEEILIDGEETTFLTRQRRRNSFVFGPSATAKLRGSSM